MTKNHIWALLLILVTGSTSLSTNNLAEIRKLSGWKSIGVSGSDAATPAKVETSTRDMQTLNRSDFTKQLGAVLLGSAFLPQTAEAKSYSANARNLERLNSGDSSAGSLYDNDPTSTAARRRRAMTGCKTSSAREEAAENSLGISSLTEMECNRRVMDGDADFMLQALQKLDCPSCPYGINPKRPS